MIENHRFVDWDLSSFWEKLKQPQEISIPLINALIITKIKTIKRDYNMIEEDRVQTSNIRVKPKKNSTIGRIIASGKL